MVKEWVARGIDIWLRADVTLFLQPDTQSYLLGSTNAALSFVETTLRSAAGASAVVIPVTSSTGMTAADKIGVKLNDNTIHWTTIVSVDTATQVTITTGLASAAASACRLELQKMVAIASP